MQASVLTVTVPDWNLCYPYSGPAGEYGNEAVHLAIEIHLFEDLPPLAFSVQL